VDGVRAGLGTGAGQGGRFGMPWRPLWLSDSHGRTASLLVSLRIPFFLQVGPSCPWLPQYSQGAQFLGGVGERAILVYVTMYHLVSVYVALSTSLWYSCTLRPSLLKRNRE